MRIIREFDKEFLMLQTQVLRVGQANKPCVRLIQENLMEFLIQYIYLYILTSDSPCSTISSLS